VLNIAIIWVAFSIILLYNITKVRKDALETRRLSFFILAFAIIGLIVASAEAFFLKNIFRKLPIWLSTLLRMTITFLLFVIVSILFLEISDKYGPGGLRNLIRGRYNKPRKENRIFLFLDINDSTTIAEKIGHEKYFNMLHDFFEDITEPIIANWGHIYQYVGDEVVLCWENNNKNKHRCLRFISQAVDAIKKKESYYIKEYGVAPTFKAGVHSGEVTAGYIGVIKKELVFSGDTLNTTA